MENSLIPFMYEGSSIRALTDSEGNPWFVAKDVCDILGTRTDNLKAILEDDELSNLYSIGVGGISTENGGRAPLIVSESGLYSLILRSRKPEAREFKRWVTHEVLPSIRKRGGYLTPEATEKALTDPDFIIQLATSLKEERSRREELENKVATDEPFTRFGRAITASDGELLVKQVADVLTQEGVPVNQVRLFAWLRAHGWLCRNKGDLWNAPTKWALERGFVRASVTAITTNRGTKERVTPKITAAGQAYLIDGFLDGRFRLFEEATA